MSFETLNLAEPLLRALNTLGYQQPRPIQVESIPSILAKKDVVAAAETGSGKTAGFVLPLLQLTLEQTSALRSNHVRHLILVPTRELAIQVHKAMEAYGQFASLRLEAVYGGVKINPQMMKMRKGVDLLVATPGRLLDLVKNNAVKLDQLESLVLDEADRMLDMGFMPDVKKIIALSPEKRQNLLFSATFPPEIKKLTHSICTQAVSISVNKTNAAGKNISQLLCPVDKKKKGRLLSFLIGHNRWPQVLVFVRTKRGANKVAYDLVKAGITAAAIHGDKSQGARVRALQEFKDLKTCVLVATDIAARGLDIKQLPVVINHDLPDAAEDYVHRIGRTGRAGEKGHAVSLVCADEVDKLRAIEKLLGKKIKRQLIDGFEPTHDVPETQDIKKVQKKKPHKKKLEKAAKAAKSVTGKRKTAAVTKDRRKQRSRKNGQSDDKSSSGRQSRSSRH